MPWLIWSCISFLLPNLPVNKSSPWTLCIFKVLMIPSSPDSILTTQFQDPGFGPSPNGALETHFRGLFVLWGGWAGRPQVHLPPTGGSPLASSVLCFSWESLGPLTTWLDQSLSPPWLTGIGRTPLGSSSLRCDCHVGQPTLTAWRSHILWGPSWATSPNLPNLKTISDHVPRIPFRKETPGGFYWWRLWFQPWGQSLCSPQVTCPHPSSCHSRGHWKSG